MGRGNDLRILSDDGEAVIVTVTELAVGPDDAPNDIAQQVDDAIADQFSDDDSIIIER